MIAETSHVSLQTLQHNRQELGFGVVQGPDLRPRSCNEMGDDDSVY
jgi:hypothetical protein